MVLAVSAMQAAKEDPSKYLNHVIFGACGVRLAGGVFSAVDAQRQVFIEFHYSMCVRDSVII